MHTGLNRFDGGGVISQTATPAAYRAWNIAFALLTCGLNEDELGLDPVVLLNKDFPSLDCLLLDFFEAPLPLPP